MAVYIANLGRHNYLWPSCLQKSTIATYEDEVLRPYWLAGDRIGYINRCMGMKTAAGRPPTRQVASRWFNIGLTISSTADDLWIHREKDEIWWTHSKPGEAEVFLTPTHPGTSHSPNVYQIHKPCTGWKKTDRKGRTLTWPALHPKAKEFLFTESTLQRLSGANSEYAQALIDGASLEPWHSQSAWRAMLNVRKGGIVTIFSPQQRSAMRMAMTARNTANAADGSESKVAGKIKEFRFPNEETLRLYLENLLETQEGFCALTGLKLLMDGESGDHELHCSLDRIDSDGHYEEGNLQIVCKFVNRWKGASDNDEFARLIQLLQEDRN